MPINPFDARRGEHVPTFMPCGPYTVIHSRSATPIATNTSGQNTVMLFTSFNDSAGINGGNNILPYHGIYGVGINVPGTTEQYIVDPIVSGKTANFYSLSLHAMTVSITCTDSVTNASGIVYMGTLPLRLARTAFATWNAVAINAVTRSEMKSMSAYTTAATPELAVRHNYPLDYSSYAEFLPSASNASGSNITMRDALSNIVVVLSPTSVAVNYLVTVHCEWRAMYNSDPELAATQRMHQTTPLHAIDPSRNALAASAGSSLAFGYPPPTGPGSIFGGTFAAGSQPPGGWSRTVLSF